MLKRIWKLLFPTFSEQHIRTVRYAFPLFLIASIFYGFASIVTQNDSYITIRTTTDVVTQDEVFYIEVIATTHVPVNALDLTIAYPKDKMVIDGIDTGTSVITLWTEEPYAEDGNIYLRGGTFRKGFIGEHTIARIRAHATEPGDARIFLKDSQLVAGDGKGTNVPVTKSDVDNEIKLAIIGADGVVEAKAAIGIASDADGDGDVDFKDISVFMSAWFTGRNTYDFNGDGEMTFRDFSIILAQAFLN